MSEIDLKSIKNKAKEELEKIKNNKELEEFFKTYLGKKGEVFKAFQKLGKMIEKEKSVFGKELNELKDFLTEKFEEKSREIKEKIIKELEEKEWFDVTVPGRKMRLGYLHPVTLVKRKAEEIFQLMGFTIIEGPEVESEWYNFDALNVPAEHPAREMQDTLWIEKGNGGGFLMRTHTSPVQVRYMEGNNPPLKIIAPGRVFRHEATDASHEINFYQIEGLMIDRTISVANFKAIIKEFFKRFFEKEVEIRLRPGFFPFTEPSFEVDLRCFNCGGEGCSSCSHSGWLEVMGAGMVHPNVLKNSGLIPHQPNNQGWQGFAFGIGLDRLAMMKYKINDIRLFYSGDLRFLQQFK